MQMSLMGLIAVLCVGGFAVPSFAEEMGKMQTDMKIEGMTQKDAMKGQMKGMQDEMKGQKDSMKGEMKTKHDDTQGSMKTKHDDMKGEMKGAMGK